MELYKTECNQLEWTNALMTMDIINNKIRKDQIFFT